jgi:hypothetical protein
MPSNKEIAEWMRESVKVMEYAVTCGSFTQYGQSIIKEEITKKTAAADLIEQMRCETCRWWAMYSSRCRYTADIGSVSWCDVWCGPQFCCCHWEGRK